MGPVLGNRHVRMCKSRRGRDPILGVMPKRKEALFARA